MRSIRRPLGFSAIELLATSCAVLLLATLLCPMILAAQLSSNQSRCKNNLKQIGLAIHNYHDTVRAVPPGWVTKDRSSTAMGGLGWQTMLLPYVDQAPLYNQVDFNEDLNSDSNSSEKAALRNVVKTYRCPVDVIAKTNPLRDNWPTSNYSANGGHRAFPRWTSLPGKSYWPGLVTSDSKMPWSQSSTGLMGPNSYISFRDCTDGLSNIIMVGERSGTSAGGIWPGVTSNTQENDAITDGSHASRLQKSISGFSSPHGSIFFLLGDGSVRAIKPEIDSQPNSDPAKPMGLFQKLMSRSDGQVREEIP